MKWTMVNLLFILLIHFACTKQEMPSTVDECEISNCEESKDSSYLEVVWKKPIGSAEGRSLFWGITPLLFENSVLFSADDAMNGNETLYMRDKADGELLWQWADPQYTNVRLGGYLNYQNKYLLFCDSGGPLRVYDPATGIEIWKDDLKTGYSGSSLGVIDDEVYYEHTNEFKQSTESYLVKSKIDEWKWDTVFVESKTDDFFPGLYPPASWLNNNGEEILIFQNRMFSYNHPSKTDLIAFNVDKKEVLWRHDSLDNGSSIIDPVVKDDLLYFISLDKLFCFDIPTGNLVWLYDLKNSETASLLHDTKLHFVGEKIIFEARTTRYALNAKTGTVIWKIENTDNSFVCSGQSAYHKEVLYLTCGHDIYALNANTGEILWVEETLGYDFLFGIVVDPETGYLYTANTKYAWCLKVKE